MLGPRSAVAAVLAAGLLLLAPTADAGVKAGDRAAEISGKDARGRKVTLKSLRGKWVVLTFGASWCKPCKKELPAYDKLAPRFRDKGVVFVAVNFDSSKAKGKAFMKKLGIHNMRVAYDPAGASPERYDPPTTPSTYVIDPKGIVRKLHRGYHAGDAGKLGKQLDNWLK